MGTCVTKIQRLSHKKKKRGAVVSVEE